MSGDLPLVNLLVCGPTGVRTHFLITHYPAAGNALRVF